MVHFICGLKFIYYVHQIGHRCALQYHTNVFHVLVAILKKINTSIKNHTSN